MFEYSDLKWKELFLFWVSYCFQWHLEKELCDRLLLDLAKLSIKTTNCLLLYRRLSQTGSKQPVIYWLLWETNILMTSWRRYSGSSSREFCLTSLWSKHWPVSRIQMVHNLNQNSWNSLKGFSSDVFLFWI